MKITSAVAFLQEAARYFDARPTGGEDKAHWSNVYNANNCREIALMLSCALPECDGGHKPSAKANSGINQDLTSSQDHPHTSTVKLEGA